MIGDSLWVLRLFSTTKTDRHDIAKLLLKVALSTKNQSIHENTWLCFIYYCVVLSVLFLLWCFGFFLFAFLLCLVYPMLPVSLDCSFLVAPSVFSNVYFIQNILNNCGMSNIWLGQNSCSTVLLSSSVDQKLKDHFYFKNGLKI